MTAIDLPYAHLNLRRNPFGWLEEHERAELARVDVGPIVERLADPGYAAQFIGEKGFGKTTHLLAIRRALPNASYSHLGRRGDPVATGGNPVLIDEAQRLTRGQRRMLLALPVALAFGTHTDLARVLTRAGRRVDTIEVDASTTDERLQVLLLSRIEWARRSPGPVPQVTAATANEMLARHGPDIRAILDDLYLLVETMEAPDAI